VPIRSTTSTEAASDLTRQSPACLVPQVVQVGFILPAHDCSDQSPGSVSEVRPGGHRKDLDAPESKLPQGCMHLGLVAPQAILPFNDDRLKGLGPCSFH